MHQNPPFTQNPPGPLLQSFLQLKDFVFNMATTVAGDLVKMHKAHGDLSGVLRWGGW